MAESITISAEVSMNIFNMINTIATERRRKKDEILKEALEQYIDEWTEYKIARKRLDNPTDPILTEKEFLSELKEEFGWNI